MKRILLLIAVFCIPLCGCVNKDVSELLNAPTENSPNSSAIIVRAVNVDNSTPNLLLSGEAGPVVFTGDDMLWFNEKTGELRFKDNTSMRMKLANYQIISFYLGNEYLFTCKVQAAPDDSSNNNGLLLYISSVENKYYLLDGYPGYDKGHGGANGMITSEPDTQGNGGSNPQDIEAEWGKFITQLQKEGRYNP